MNYLELQDAALRHQLDESNRGAVQQALLRRYGIVWAYRDDWPFKLPVTPATFALTAATQVAQSDSDLTAMNRPQRAWLASNPDLGLEFVSPDVFMRDWYPSVLRGTRGTPRVFTWASGGVGSNAGSAVSVAPIPAASDTLHVFYEERVWRWTGAASPQTKMFGPLTDSTDTPAWASEHHAFLAEGAAADVLREQSDPGWREREDAFAFGLATFAETIFPPQKSQYGRDVLGYG